MNRDVHEPAGGARLVLEAAVGWIAEADGWDEPRARRFVDAEGELLMIFPADQTRQFAMAAGASAEEQEPEDIPTAEDVAFVEDLKRLVASRSRGRRAAQSPQDEAPAHRPGSGDPAHVVTGRGHP